MSFKEKIKEKIKNFGKTIYSEDKKYLNAIVTSDIHFVPKHKKLAHSYRVVMLAYAFVVLSVTLVSLGMLVLRDEYISMHKTLVSFIEVSVFVVLLIDVGLRWYTSEVKIKKGNWSYFLFPATLTGVILITSLLPSLYLINVWTGKNYEIFEDFENMKFLRIFRIILLANLVPGVQIFSRVLVKERSVLYVVFSIVIITIILFALVIFNIEQGADSLGHKKGEVGYLVNEKPQFDKFWDALYFSTITLTTIGFGDKSPHTEMGKAVTMVMSIVGIAVLATPSGVIAGGFISEIKQTRKEREETKLIKHIRKAKK